MGRKSGKESTRRYRLQYQQRRRQRLLKEHADAVAAVRALAEEDLADEDLCRDLALWVRAYRHDHDGQGPYWSLIAKQARPDLPVPTQAAAGYLCFRAYTERLLRGLQQRGWLKHDRRRGSTREGRRLYEEGILPDKSQQRRQIAAVL